jgi:type IV pilus assembly protein PilM
VAIPFRIFSANTTLRPKLACEITPEGVIGARQDKADEALMSFAPFQPGIVRPGLGAGNFTDHSRVVAALREALDEVALREKQLTVVVPDAAVRVLVLDFDTLPAKAQEALPIVRFRLRKLTPFEVDDSAVSYQVIRQEREHMRVLATVMPGLVRAEYEDAVRAAGYEPGVILPSTLAALAALTTNGAALVVNRNGLSLTTAITSGDELLLHRTLELPAEDSEFHYEELAQSVSVAMAYFEDTLKTEPEAIYYVGPGGAEEFIRVLGPVAEEHGPRIRDLVMTPATGAMSAMPKGLIAGVVGALAS